MGGVHMPFSDTPPAIVLPHLASEFEVSGEPQPKRSLTIIRPRCAAGKPGEIVVCAGNSAQHRLEPLGDTPVEALPKAQFQVSERAAVDLHVETNMISGTPSNRTMVGLKIGF
jgi:hypothetical protein